MHGRGRRRAKKARRGDSIDAAAGSRENFARSAAAGDFTPQRLSAAGRKGRALGNIGPAFILRGSAACGYLTNTISSITLPFVANRCRSHMCVRFARKSLRTLMQCRGRFSSGPLSARDVPFRARTPPKPSSISGHTSHRGLD